MEIVEVAVNRHEFSIDLFPTVHYNLFKNWGFDISVNLMQRSSATSFQKEFPFPFPSGLKDRLSVLYKDFGFMSYCHFDEWEIPFDIQVSKLIRKCYFSFVEMTNRSIKII